MELGEKTWGKVSVFRYSMGIGAALLDQPHATGQSFYPLSQSTFGHIGYLRHEGYFELTHLRKRKRDVATPLLGAMVPILKG